MIQDDSFDMRLYLIHGLITVNDHRGAWLQAIRGSQKEFRSFGHDHGILFSLW